MLKFLALIAAAAVSTDEGFQPLFNGKDLSGWSTHFEDPKVKAADVYSVKDGTLVCRGAGKPGGYVITNKEYGDYVLRLQWRFPPGSKGGNSGVLLHTQDGPNDPRLGVWPKSVEAQLQHGQAGDFWVINAKLDIDPARNNPASRRNFIRIGERWENGKAVRKSFEKPIGEWNQYEIHCDGNTIRLFVNGTLVNEGKNGELSKGKILLQAEGADIEFRNIEIKSK
jgi:hypothetical protein